MRFANSAALISGAAVGLGAATARLLLMEGASVALLDIDDEQLSITARELAAVGNGVVHAVPCDITDIDAVDAAVRECVEHVGPLNVLISNAGLNGHDHTLEGFSLSDWTRVFAVNALAPHLLAHHVVPYMKAQKRGAIVNVSSVGAVYGAGGGHGYRAAKASLHSLTRTLAIELAPYGIRVNTLCPGAMDTPMRRKAAQEREVTAATTIPLGRVAAPEEIATCVAFLASDDARYVTGATLIADGGRSVV